MTSDTTISEASDSPNFTPKFYGIVLLVAAIVATGMWLVGRFSDVDLARDMQTWREKLNLIAESRTVEVEGWVSQNFKELRSLADNPSLQLYMTELQMLKESGKKSTDRDADASGEPSQKSYLRNLLLFTAQRSGFTAAGATAIPANVKQGSKSGLAIIDANNSIVASTMMASSTKDMMIEHIRQSEPGQEGLIDIRKDKDGTPYIGFIVPVFSIQGDRNASAQIGRVVGIKALDASLFSLLKHPGTTEKTLETIIVRRTGDKIEYLSPLLDGSDPLGKEMSYDSEKLAESRLMQAQGGFAHSLKDYRDKTILATSRPIAGTPWMIVIKIDRDEALAESSQRRASMEVFFFLIIAIIALIVSATWWRANSKRSLLLSGYFRRLAARAQAQEQLLRLVADHQPEPIYIVDANQTLQFANRQAAAEAKMSIESMTGKTLWDIRGTSSATQIVQQCETVLKAGQIAYDVQRLRQGGKEKVMRNAFVPLDHIPVVSLPEPTPGVLVVEQDISEVVHEREQRLKTQRQLIETLVMLVDKRDPFAANHSKLVSQIAYEVAVEMELDSVTIETTSKAGSLMNIGKIVVPTELLTKTTALTPEEKRTIHDSMNTAAELLDGISFDGPVAETLRQWQEKWDGTGPMGLKKEEILISARIIATANAFVGMISPRSWRTAIPIESANKFLLDQCETHFDRRVVVALINFVDNHSGKAWLNQILNEHKDAA
jgi:PAS domain-containing protein